MKILFAKLIWWFCDDFCELMGHFNIHPDGYPGCIGNWKWFGFGPNRWQNWAGEKLGYWND